MYRRAPDGLLSPTICAIRFDGAHHAFRITREITGANTYFRTLPGGRSLSDLLNDGSLWVNL